jgi:hypothetical protein
MKFQHRWNYWKASAKRQSVYVKSYSNIDLIINWHNGMYVLSILKLGGGQKIEINQIKSANTKSRHQI